MASQIISYTTSGTSLFSPDGSMTLTPPITFGPGIRHKLRVLRFSVPQLVPNVWSSAKYGTTAVFWISWDGGTNWDEITLVNGAYSIPALQDAIQLATATHFTSAGITLTGNLTTGTAYFTFDETKLVNPLESITMKLDPTITAGIGIGQVSQFGQVLGFVPGAGSTFTGTGTHVGGLPAQLDILGNEVSIQLDGDLGRVMSTVNGQISRVLFTMPLGTPILYGNNFSIQGGIIAPAVDINPSNPINRILLSFRSLADRPILLLDGVLSVDLELISTR